MAADLFKVFLFQIFRLRSVISMVYLSKKIHKSLKFLNSIFDLHKITFFSSPFALNMSKLTRESQFCISRVCLSSYLALDFSSISYFFDPERRNLFSGAEYFFKYYFQSFSCIPCNLNLDITVIIFLKRTYYRNDPRGQLFQNQNKYFALRILSRSRHNFVLI